MIKKQRIQDALRAWASQKTNPSLISPLFGKGSFFKLTVDEFNLLKISSSSKVYAYLGIENENLIVVLMPDGLDKTPIANLTDTELESVIIKEFKADLDVNALPIFDKVVDGPDITVRDAYTNHHNWNLSRDFYFNNVPANEMLDLISVPFAGLSLAFEANGVNRMYFSFGLKQIDDTQISSFGFAPEFISWGQGSDGNTSPYDVKVPCPPYYK